MKAQLVTVGTFRFFFWTAVRTVEGKTINEFRAKTCDKVQKYHDKDGEPVFGIQYWVKKNQASCLNAVLAFAIGKGLCTKAQTENASCITTREVQIAEKAIGFKSEVNSSVLLGVLNPPAAPAPAPERHPGPTSVARSKRDSVPPSPFTFQFTFGRSSRCASMVPDVSQDVDIRNGFFQRSYLWLTKCWTS